MTQGLTSEEAAQKLKQFGPNEIPEKTDSLLDKLIKNLSSPITLMLLLASVLSFFLQKVFDGWFILGLLALNLGITIWQESKADNAIRKLNEHLDQKIKVFRDQNWIHLLSSNLVPGDLIELSSGEVIPADGKIVEANRVTVNESVLTGESLPKDKKAKDQVFSGSFLTGGIAQILITSTGKNTGFGKTLFSMERQRGKSLLEKDILSISRFLTIFSLGAIALLSAVFLIKKAPFLELLSLDLSLLIAGVPVSLPTVMTLIIEFGVLNLAGKNVIVRRLSALEDLANVNFLLTDKTGTLTKNKITVEDIYAYGGFTHNDVLSLAAIVSGMETDNPIDLAILEKARGANLFHPEGGNEATPGGVDFIPADSKRKRSTVFLKKDGQNLVISMGAPQIIESFCKLDSPTKSKYELEVETLAKNGFRTLAVARSENGQEKNMAIVGLLALSDELRPDAKSIVQFLEDNGISVSMVTGDNRAIAYQIARQLELNGGKVVTKDDLEKLNWQLPGRLFEDTGAFAEVLPEDKLKLVELAKKYFVVSANGDGINDLPAVKAANVGMAVSSAVSALKATADIVLLSPGISVIKDAIIESRKIFERLYTYSLYRISESFRLIVTITFLGLWYGIYPLTALQIILVALLNDIPIISLAFDRVKIATKPEKIKTKERFGLSSLYGMVGVANSLILFFIMTSVWRLSWPVVQTMYFLKLTVSGHLLIYVAHTKEKWFKFLPSREVIWATTLTQLVATALALTGFLMAAKLSLSLVAFVWAWSFVWMQVAEVMKRIRFKSDESLI